MLFKLAVKNIRKSFKDYAIYFLTLILAVAIFYMFNALDSQEAMLEVNRSTREIIRLMIQIIGMVSVLVAGVLGFLIVYANNFMIRRRKKEFGIYMILGMGKRQISGILFGETLVIGLLSLVVGAVVGIFGSQLMSVLVAKLFQADMSAYRFIFSRAALVKTCVYFGIMYAAVMCFNAIIISKCKLIDLLTAVKKNEEIRMKNPVVCSVVFVLAAGMLGWAYYRVTGNVRQITTAGEFAAPVLAGIVATFLIFWSLSGLVLRIVQANKSWYLRDTNFFVIRQVNNKINTTVVSMTVICLLLFLTISILSTSLSLNRILTQNLKEMTPVDLNLTKSSSLPDDGTYSETKVEDSYRSITDTLGKYGLNLSVLKDTTEIAIYAVDSVTWSDSMRPVLKELKQQYPMIGWDTKEQIVRLSDYNRIAELYGIQKYSLSDQEYMVLCDYDVFKDMRDLALSKGTQITVAGKTYHPKYNSCKPGYINMSTGHNNIGILLVPDSCPLTERMMQYHFLAANYNAQTDEEKQQIEDMFDGQAAQGSCMRNLKEADIKIDGVSRISIVDSSRGLSTIITFIAIYMGVIFLIASSAILALKELSETTDNKERYAVLRRIGVEEGMLDRALFKQIGIFFLVPLLLAILHSVFGIRFALTLSAIQIKTQDMLPSVIGTAIFLIAVYGGYFLATYVGSKEILKEKS